MKPFVTNAAGDFLFSGKTGAGALYKKEVIRAGTYQHPITPWPEPLSADRDYLERVAANTNEALSRGIEVPVPDTHTDKPEDNKGYVRRVYVEDVDEGGQNVPALVADVEFLDDDIVPKIGQTIRRVSGWFTPHGDGEWTPEGERLRHVALTNYPVASRQENFVALSEAAPVSSPDETKASVLTREDPRPGDEQMQFSEQQIEAMRALGIELPEDGAVSEAVLDALIAKANVEPPKPEKPMGIDAAGAALSISPDTPFYAKYRGEAAKTLDTEINAAKEAGKLTEDGANAFRTLLSTDHAFALSDEGVAAPTDVAAAARALVAALPDNASVPVEKRLANAEPEIQKNKPDDVDPAQLADDALKAAKLK